MDIVFLEKQYFKFQNNCYNVFNPGLLIKQCYILLFCTHKVSPVGSDSLCAKDKDIKIRDDILSKKEDNFEAKMVTLEDPLDREIPTLSFLPRRGFLCREGQKNRCSCVRTSVRRPSVRPSGFCHARSARNQQICGKVIIGRILFQI